jgi:hypothetical protein
MVKLVKEIHFYCKEMVRFSDIIFIKQIYIMILIGKIGEYFYIDKIKFIQYHLFLIKLLI